MDSLASRLSDQELISNWLLFALRQATFLPFPFAINTTLPHQLIHKWSLPKWKFVPSWRLISQWEQVYSFERSTWKLDGSWKQLSSLDARHHMSFSNPNSVVTCRNVKKGMCVNTGKKVGLVSIKTSFLILLSETLVVHKLGYMRTRPGSISSNFEVKYMASRLYVQCNAKKLVLTLLVGQKALQKDVQNVGKKTQEGSYGACT